MNLGAVGKVLTSRARRRWKWCVAALVLVAVSPLLWQTWLAAAELRRERKEAQQVVDSVSHLNLLIAREQSLQESLQVEHRLCEQQIDAIKSYWTMRKSYEGLTKAQEERGKTELVEVSKELLDAIRQQRESLQKTLVYQQDGCCQQITFRMNRDLELQAENDVLAGKEATRRYARKPDGAVNIPVGPVVGQAHRLTFGEKIRYRLRHRLRQWGYGKL